MIEEKEKFYFVPISKKHHLGITREWTASITRLGTIRLNTSATRELIGDCKFARVLLDQDQRTIALQFASKITVEKSWRRLWFSGGQAVMSTANIMSALGCKGLNLPRLPLKIYQDKDYGKVVYFKVPKWQKKTIEEVNPKPNES